MLFIEDEGRFYQGFFNDKHSICTDTWFFNKIVAGVCYLTLVKNTVSAIYCVLKKNPLNSYIMLFSA